MSEQEKQQDINAENVDETVAQQTQNSESQEVKAEEAAAAQAENTEEQDAEAEKIEEEIAAMAAKLTPEELRGELLSARLSIRQLQNERKQLKSEFERKQAALQIEKATVMAQYDEYKKNVSAEQEDKHKKLMEVTQKKLAEAIAANEEEISRIRTRCDNEIAKAKSFALEGFVKDLIPSIEPLEKALFYSDRNNPQQKDLIEGLEMTMELILKAISKNGVEVIDPLNQLFDPNYHQAIQHIPNPAVPANHVMGVIQKGYALNGRLLKPALVVVSSGN